MEYLEAHNLPGAHMTGGVSLSTFEASGPAVAGDRAVSSLDAPVSRVPAVAGSRRSALVEYLPLGRPLAAFPRTP